jgi:PIN domain nuclease of toxin-antitoxin system
VVIESVLDASAVLARLHDEPGAEIVRAALPTACMSAVNYAEAISKLIDAGLPFAEAENVIDRLYCEVIEADKSRSALVGSMQDVTRRTGVSMGDRFCLQLGRELGVPVLTTDRRWKDLDLGVEVVVIR